MEFIIENGAVFSTLKVVFAQGESFRAEAGAMVGMSPSVELEAKASGKGILGTLKAAIGGESLFMSTFTAKSGPGEVVLAPPAPGAIVQMEIKGQTIFAEGGAYLAGSTTLELSTQGSFKALISGEGLFLQKITGNGMLFLSSYGAIMEKSLAPNESYVIDTGHIVAFEGSTQYKVKKAAKGFFSSIASGEGLVTEFTGPGKVWMQSRNLPAFVNIIQKFLPKQTSI